MTPPELTPGVYRLTEDVPNPERDKRCKDAWNAELFKKGTWFIYDEYTEMLGPNDDKPVTRRELSIYGVYSSIGPKNARWGAIASKLEWVPESISTWMAINWPNRGVLIPAEELFEKLAAMGRLTLKDLKEAYAEVQRDRQEEWARKHPQDAKK